MTEPDSKSKTYTYTSDVPPYNLHVLTLVADGVVEQGTGAPLPQAASVSPKED